MIDEKNLHVMPCIDNDSFCSHCTLPINESHTYVTPGGFSLCDKCASDVKTNDLIVVPCCLHCKFMSEKYTTTRTGCHITLECRLNGPTCSSTGNLNDRAAYWPIVSAESCCGQYKESKNENEVKPT